MNLLSHTSGAGDCCCCVPIADHHRCNDHLQYGDHCLDAMPSSSSSFAPDHLADIMDIPPSGEFVYDPPSVDHNSQLDLHSSACDIYNNECLTINQQQIRYLWINANIFGFFRSFFFMPHKSNQLVVLECQSFLPNRHILWSLLTILMNRIHGRVIHCINRKM